jgi:hypothetical protein
MVLRPGCCDWRVEVAAVVGSVEDEAGLILFVDTVVGHPRTRSCRVFNLRERTR